MNDIIIGILTTLGTLMILLAAVGMVRMPDFYLRLSVTTKAATLGIALMLISAAIFFNQTSISTRVIAIIFFLIVTAPVGAYMIGRTSYFIGIKLWSKSLFDDLAGMYHEESHELSSKMPENATDDLPLPEAPDENRLDT